MLSGFSVGCFFQAGFQAVPFNSGGVLGWTSPFNSGGLLRAPPPSLSGGVLGHFHWGAKCPHSAKGGLFKTRPLGGCGKVVMVVVEVAVNSAGGGGGGAMVAVVVVMRYRWAALAPWFMMSHTSQNGASDPTSKKSRDMMKPHLYK